MAVGKNKKMAKYGKKAKKKTVDPFLRKEWFDIKAPGMFVKRHCGKTMINRTTGDKIASEQLKGRVLELNLADLNDDADQAHKKIKLIVDDVQGRSCLTDFYGMELTRDKGQSMMQKWQTTIEAYTDLKTADNYIVRIFVITFTDFQVGQIKSHCYAKSSHVRKIRARMLEVVRREASGCKLRDLVKKLIPDSIGTEIQKACKLIFPLKNTFVRKVKVVKRPKFDITKFMEMHGHGDADYGTEMVRPETEEAQNMLTADIVPDAEEE